MAEDTESVQLKLTICASVFRCIQGYATENGLDDAGSVNQKTSCQRQYLNYEKYLVRRCLDLFDLKTDIVMLPESVINLIPIRIWV